MRVLLDYIHHLIVLHLTVCPHTSVSSITAGLTVPLRDTGLAFVCVVTASWCLPCEWCRRRGGVWYDTTSDRADRTASRGPAPSEWPGTGWHPSAPSPSIWQSRKSWRRHFKQPHRREYFTFMNATYWVLKKEKKHFTRSYLHILEFF